MHTDICGLNWTPIHWIDCIITQSQASTSFLDHNPLQVNNIYSFMLHMYNKCDIFLRLLDFSFVF